MTRKTRFIFLLLSAILLLGACSMDKDDDDTVTPKKTQTISSEKSIRKLKILNNSNLFDVKITFSSDGIEPLVINSVIILAPHTYPIPESRLPFGNYTITILNGSEEVSIKKSINISNLCCRINKDLSIDIYEISD